MEKTNALRSAWEDGLLFFANALEGQTIDNAKLQKQIDLLRIEKRPQVRRDKMTDPQVWVALVVAAAALAGALGSQWIAAQSALQSRRLELHFRAKADAYKGLLERMGEFDCSPLEHPKYITFLAAYETALLFASEEVAQLLSGPMESASTLSVCAQRELKTSVT